MSKLLRQNVGGTDYTMVGCALSATCATAAATAAKVAELTDGDVLADGMSVAVQFTNGNTAASPLTLTVGGVTANICDSRGQNIGGNIWQAGNVVTFLYTFGKFLLLNCVVDEVTLNNMNSVSSNAVAKLATQPIYAEVACAIKGIIRFFKFGTMVIANYFAADNTDMVDTAEGQWVTVATIPEGFRPGYYVYCRDEGSNAQLGQYGMDSTGVIRFYRNGGQLYGWEVAFNLIWVVPS